MAELLPLNKFRLITKSLESGSNSVYKEDIDISTIILNMSITNITEDVQTFTVLFKKENENSVTYIKNMKLPPEETVAVVGGEGKITLEQNSEIIIETDNSGSLDVTLSILENANN